MFVKKSWNTKAKKRHYQYHIAESYRDKETGQTRHKLLMNITKLPDHVIEAIDESLKKGGKVTSEDVKLETGYTLWGAGILSFYGPGDMREWTNWRITSTRFKRT